MTYEKILTLDSLELMNLAMNSSDKEVLEVLSHSKLANVRRALAKNISISPKIIDGLLYDPVLNVSYIANQNPNCTEKRDFSDIVITSCVKCNIDERQMDCNSCIQGNQNFL